MVEESNVDGELKVLNHLLLDLLLPFHLDDQARAYGQTEVQHLLRKYWLPWRRMTSPFIARAHGMNSA